MSGFHETYAITEKGSIRICAIDGQYLIYSTMHGAACGLALLTKIKPGVEFTIRKLEIRLPWSA